MTAAVFAAFYLADIAVSGPVTAALVALAGLLYTHARGLKQENDARLRGQYSEAYQAAVAWEEMVYRVWRRAPDESEEKDLKKHFHDLQERITYYCGWLSTESGELGTAYEDLVKECKDQSRPLIQKGWGSDPLPLKDPLVLPDGLQLPDLTAAKQEFLGRVRDSFPGMFTN